MRTSMDIAFTILWLLLIYSASTGATDSEIDNPQKDRTGRSWHSALFGGQQQMLMQNPSLVPTSQPGASENQPTSTQVHPTGSNRNFEDHDKSALPSEQDYMSRHFGYMNVHRFDPSFPYYDRQVFPRFPSPQVPGHNRFGPGYRKDKYGHGYGYSCKQGDDCDEVRAANQITAARHPPLPPPPPAFNTHYPDLPPFPSMPSFGPYFGGLQQPTPSRFNDPHLAQPHHLMAGHPSRFYQARYLHDEDSKEKSSVQGVQQDIPEDKPTVNE